MLAPWTKSYDQPRQDIKKQRHYFVNKGPSSQGYGFSSGHVWMWELGYKENWALKNDAFELWCWRRLLRVPWTARRSNQSGDQSWVFIGRTDAKTETPILWPPHEKNWLIWKDPVAGKDWRQEEKEMTEDEMASPTQWTWVWVSSGSWWWTGKPDVLQSKGSQSLTGLSDWTELNMLLKEEKGAKKCILNQMQVKKN